MDTVKSFIVLPSICELEFGVHDAIERLDIGHVLLFFDERLHDIIVELIFIIGAVTFGAFIPATVLDYVVALLGIGGVNWVHGSNITFDIVPLSLFARNQAVILSNLVGH